ncbi:MAG: HIT family protein [archaeon]
MVLTPEKIEEIKKQLSGLNPEEQQTKLQEILQTLDPKEREQLTGGPQQCPFCLMAEGKIDVIKVYEDVEVLAILDINPANPGHTLVFTKKHNTTINDLTPYESDRLFTPTDKIAKAISKALGAAGVNLYLASGAAAGQTAPHLLINIIPRFENDGIRFGWQPKKQDPETMKKIAKNISNNLEEEKPMIEEVIDEDDEDEIIG